MDRICAFQIWTDAERCPNLEVYRATLIDLFSCRFSIKRIRLSYQRLGRSHGTMRGLGRHKVNTFLSSSKIHKRPPNFATHPFFIPSNQSHSSLSSSLKQLNNFTNHTQSHNNAFRCFHRYPYHLRRVDTPPVLVDIRDLHLGVQLVHKPQLSPMLPLRLARVPLPQLPFQVNNCTCNGESYRRLLTSRVMLTFLSLSTSIRIIHHYFQLSCHPPSSSCYCFHVSNVPNHSIILQLHVAHHTLTIGGSSLLFIFGGERLHAFVRMEESNEVIPFVYMYRP